MLSHLTPAIALVNMRNLTSQVLESDVATLKMVDEQLNAFMADMERDVK